MNVIIAILVAWLMTTAGIAGGIWRLGGILARRADRVGGGSVPAGMLLQRVRTPVLTWALLLAGAAILLAVLWWESTGVRYGLLVGAVVGAGFLVLLPPLVPILTLRLLRAVRGRLPGIGNRR